MSPAAHESWCNYLGGAPPIPFPRSVKSASGTRRALCKASLELPVDYVVRLADLASAWAVLLCLYTHSPEVTFGIWQQSHETDGSFPCPVPVRIQRNNHGLQTDALEAVMSAADNSTAFSDHSIEYDNVRSVLIFGHSLHSGKIGLLERYAVVLHCWSNSGYLHLSVYYDDASLTSTEIQCLTEQFHHLHQMGISQTSPCGGAALLDKKDRSDLISWNMAMPDSADQCVHHIVSKRAEESPKLIAVDAWDGRLTYEELDARSLILSNELMRMTQTRGIIIPLCFPKGCDAIVAVLAVAKAEAASVMLDPTCPAGHVHHILKEAKASFVLGPSACRLEYLDILYLSIEDYKHCFVVSNPPCKAIQPVDSLPQDLFCIVFTSGSTDDLKGCSISHKAIFSMAASHSRQTSVNTTSRVLHIAPYASVGGLAEIVIVLQARGCLCVPQPADALANLQNVVNEMKVTWADVCCSTPALLQISKSPTIGTLLLSGEPLNRHTVLTWAEHVRLMNSYGSAESFSFISCTVDRMTVDTTPSNIGKAQGGRMWVVNPKDHHQLVPIGAIGELVLEGPGLASGYFLDDLRTSKSVIEAPTWMDELGIEPCSALYTTGDLARYDSDGSVHLLSRKDTQVEIHGKKLEVGEVEFEIQQCLEDFEVVVEKAQPVDSVEAILVAFIFKMAESTTHVEPDLVHLREILETRLPAYMVPVGFIVVPDADIPRTFSGKVDRVRLATLGSRFYLDDLIPSPLTDEQTSSPFMDELIPTPVMDELISSPFNDDDDWGIPMSKEELDVVPVWEMALGHSLSHVSKHDNFFQLGGDSLSAAKVVEYGRREGIPLTLAQMLSQPTIYEQARLPPVQREVAEDRAPEQPDASLRLSEEEADIVLQASDFQTSMIVGELSGADTEVHNLRVKFDSPVDGDNLREFLLLFLERHPAMRSVFRVHDGQLYQVVLKQDVSPNVISMTGADQYLLDLERNTQKTLVGGEFQPLHIWMIQESGRVQSIHMRVSHCLFDGAFFTRFCEELKDYGTLEAPTENLSRLKALQAPTINIEEAVTYWTDLLKGSTNSSLINRFQPAIYSPFDGKCGYTVKLPISSGSDVPMSIVLDVAWALTLRDYLGDDDVVFGTYMAGRTIDTTLRPIVGCSLAIVPMRLTIKADQSSNSLLKLAQRQFIASLPYSRLGESTIIRKCTNWRPWERLSTLLLHKNAADVGLEGMVNEPFDSPKLGTRCTATLDEAYGDYTDLEILTYPDPRKNTIDLQFYHNSRILPKCHVLRLAQAYAEKIQLLTEQAPSTLVGTLAHSIPESFPLVETAPVEVKAESSMTASREEELRNEVATVWSSILPDLAFDWTTPFWRKGEPLSAICLVLAYQKHGHDISVDDLLHFPSMADQVRLLASTSDQV